MSFPHHLKFAVITLLKILDRNDTSIVGSRILYRRDIELSKILAQTFGGTYEILSNNDHELGRSLGNGSWTGTIGMVLRSEVDLVVSLVGLTLQTSQILNFSFPFHRSLVTFATRKPENEPDPIVLLRPFSFEVWIFTILSIFFIMMAFYKMFRQKTHKMILVPYQILFGQDAQTSFRKTSHSILFITWAIGAMFLGYSYSAVLLSFLTFPTLRGVRTISELAAAVEDGKYECTTYEGTFLSYVFIKANDRDTRIIGYNMAKKKGTFFPEEVLENTNSSKKQAYVGGKPQLLTYASKYFISEDEFIPVWQIIFMRRDFCCKAHVHRFVGLLWQSGINQKLLMDEIFISSLKKVWNNVESDKNKRVRKLSLLDLKGAFVVLVSGYNSATIVLLFEIICSKSMKFMRCVSKSNKKKKRRKRA